MHRPLAAFLLSLSVAACGGDESASSPSATVAMAPSPTPSTIDERSALEAEVEAAYLRSWEVYAHALRTLSTEGLEESFAGPALESTKAEVERLRAANTPISVDVEHQLSLVFVTSREYEVRDQQVNHSVFLDPSTGQPTETPPNNGRTFVYRLEEREDLWHIVAVYRLS